MLTDSASDLNPELAKQMGLHLVHLAVQFDGRCWGDHDPLLVPDMFARMRRGAAPPALVLPTMLEYLETVEEMLGHANHLIALHSGPGFGALYSLALQVSSQFEGRLTVVNAGTTSGAMALLAERAARMARDGAEPAVILRALQAVQSAQTTRLCPSSLALLQRNSFLRLSSSLLPTMRRYRPIFKIDAPDKKRAVAFEQAARGRQNAVEVMRRAIREHVSAYPASRAVFVHNGRISEIMALQAEASQLGVIDHLTLEMGAALSSFVGEESFGFSLEPIEPPPT